MNHDELVLFAGMRPSEPRLTEEQKTVLREELFVAMRVPRPESGPAGRAPELEAERDRVRLANGRPFGMVRRDAVGRPWVPALMAAALVAIAIGGLWANASLRNDTDLGPSDEPIGTPLESVVTSTAPTGAGGLIFSPTTGQEPALFEYAVTSADRTSYVRIVEVTDSSVCAEVEHDGAVSEPCVDALTVATGLAYGVIGLGDGTYLAFGVVPDAVDLVEVGGAPVELAGNVWSTVLPDNTPADLRVASAAAGQFATLPAAGTGSPVPSTTGAP